MGPFTLGFSTRRRKLARPFILFIELFFEMVIVSRYMIMNSTISNASGNPF